MHRLQFSWPILISDFFSHLNNSQNKVLFDWKEEETVTLKWVAVCNKTDVISHYVYKWSFFPPNLIKCVIFHIKFLLCFN